MTSSSKSIIVLETERFMADPSRTTLDEGLCQVLQCPSVDDPYKQFLPEVKDISDSDMADLRACLPAVFSKLGHSDESIYDRASLLAGLYQYSCWRQCIATESGAYQLACGIINYLGDFDADVGLDLYAADKVVSLLNEWVMPPTAWPEPPDIGELCTILFDPTWCLLALPEKCMKHTTLFPGDAGRIAVDLILRDRPAFRAGLCRAQEAALAMAAGIVLPENLGPSA